MIHSRGANASDAEVVWTQILQGMGGGMASVTIQVGAQASVTHADVAMATAVVLLITEIGGSIGTAVAGAIWTNRMPGELVKSLGGFLNQTEIDTIYSSVAVAAALSVARLSVAVAVEFDEESVAVAAALSVASESVAVAVELAAESVAVESAPFAVTVTVTVTAGGGSLLIDPGSGKHPSPVRLPSIHFLSLSDPCTRRLFLPAVVDVLHKPP